MDVTNKNFLTVIPEFDKLFDSCDFYSFDEEMTGINFPNEKEKNGSKPGEAWALKRKVASTFAIIQFGIALFHKNQSGGYDCRPFNFYLFPETEQDLNMSASAIQFNKKHNMNFQRWIYDGIGYVDEIRRSELNVALQEKLDRENNPDQKKSLSLYSEKDKEWYEKASKRFKSWHEDEDQNTEFDINATSYTQRLFFQQEASKVIEKLAFVSRSVNNKRRYVAIKQTEEEKKLKAKKDHEWLLKGLKKQVGFSHVFSKMIQSGKPIIGHNCLYDFLFMMNSFYKPLVEDWDEMKKEMHTLFPHIYDTKVMSKHFGDRFQSTALEPLYKSIIQESEENSEKSLVDVHLPLGFQDYHSDVLKNCSSSESRAHEAGYDAYMTGVIFLNLRKDAENTGLEINHFENRMNLMFSFYEMNVSGQDKFICEGPVLLVSGFESKTKTVDLLQMMGGHEGRVMWIDDNSCYFVMAKAVEETEILTHLTTSFPNVNFAIVKE